MSARPLDILAAGLPVGAVLPRIGDALQAARPVVLAAPPGAGKTTLVPLAMLDAPWRNDDRIILIEPRRLAARAAARRMATLLNEPVGETVGYRMRLDSRVSKRTRIEVVTEGVFVRMILDDPELKGISAVLFDEFHERALEADFGLALVLEVMAALRDDLRLVVMSATLDVARIARLIANPEIIESAGRAHPVEMRYQERRGDTRIEDAMATAIRNAVATEQGSILAFLPGQAEIRRVMERLEGRLPADIVIAPLYGMMEGGAQDRAIAAPPAGTRKLVLSTAIAETSITIDGVRIVIDSGLERLPQFEPATGITRLETVRVSRASADQRAGRAGRTEPGIAIRLWREEQTQALAPFRPPAILASDLTGLLLDCAAWGTPDPLVLSFLDPPPVAALSEARKLLVRLAALDDSGALTPTGRAMRALGLPARLSAMVVTAPPAARRHASELAVLMTEPGLGGVEVDLAERHRRFSREGGTRAAAARDLAKRQAASVDLKTPPATDGSTTGLLLASAFPDRIAMQRGARGRYILANGRGAVLDETLALAGSRYLVVADLTGQAGAQRVLSAVALTDDEMTHLAETLAATVRECMFDPATRSVRAISRRRIGAIVLSETPVALLADDDVAGAMKEGVALLGVDALPWSKEGRHLRSRLAFLRATLGEPWPDVTDASLQKRLEDWFLPYHPGVSAFGDIQARMLEEGLMSLVPPDLQRDLALHAPTHVTVPTGSKIAIRYDGDVPVLSVRVQELFGLTTHPTIAGGRMPLVLELLSPAHRPLQTTRDLPGFWAGSWADVRAEMRGRYPKHVWPENPAEALATRRAKPRGSA